MTIFSIENELVAEGDFTPEVTIVGATREECLAAIQGQCLYFQDLGPSRRNDSYYDEQGALCSKETMLYTLLGGSIR